MVYDSAPATALQFTVSCVSEFIVELVMVGLPRLSVVALTAVDHCPVYGPLDAATRK
jgi:hypothetical protein